MSEPVLTAKGLVTRLRTSAGDANAVDGVSFDLLAGETLALVGESGSGKSVTALSLMRLVPDPPGRVVAGEIRFQGRDLLRLRDREMRALRGDAISMIFQEPMSSLNPVTSIGRQVMEPLLDHERLDRGEARRRAREVLELVRIPDAARRMRQYPHELSGGMRQRVMIAMALACRPSVLIADEPTTALDVTTQAQILALIEDLQRSTGAAVLLITHDLGVVAETARRVIVMYGGRIVEESLVEDLFHRPLHPYTRALMASMPHLLPVDHPRLSEDALIPEIPGLVPALTAMPEGCRVEPRCALATGRCRTADPALRSLRPQHRVACWEAVA